LNIFPPRGKTTQQVNLGGSMNRSITVGILWMLSLGVTASNAQSFAHLSSILRQPYVSACGEVDETVTVGTSITRPEAVRRGQAWAKGRAVTASVLTYDQWVETIKPDCADMLRERILLSFYDTTEYNSMIMQTLTGIPQSIFVMMAAKESLFGTNFLAQAGNNPFSLRYKKSLTNFLAPAGFLFSVDKTLIDGNWETREFVYLQFRDLTDAMAAFAWNLAQDQYLGAVRGQRIRSGLSFYRAHREELYKMESMEKLSFILEKFEQETQLAPSHMEPWSDYTEESLIEVISKRYAEGHTQVDDYRAWLDRVKTKSY